MTGQETLQAFLQQVPVVWTNPKNPDHPIKYTKITELIYWRDKDNKLRVSASCPDGNSSCQVACQELVAPNIDKDIAFDYVYPKKSLFVIKAFKTEDVVCELWDKSNTLYGRIERVLFSLDESGRVLVKAEIKHPKTAKILTKKAVELADKYTYKKRKENKNVQI